MASFLHRLTTPGWQRALLVRRLVAILLILAAGLIALPRPADEGTAEVVVFTREVAAGATVGEGDLTVRRADEELVPAGALRDVGAAVDRVAVAAIGAGEIATEVKFVGQATAQHFDRVGGVPVGELAEPITLVPLKIASPQVIGLLQHGDTVSVVTHDEAADGAGQVPRVVASGARVVLPDVAAEAVLLALPEAAAQAVAAAALGAPLAVVITGARAAPVPDPSPGT